MVWLYHGRVDVIFASSRVAQSGSAPVQWPSDPGFESTQVRLYSPFRTWTNPEESKIIPQPKAVDIAIYRVFWFFWKGSLKPVTVACYNSLKFANVACNSRFPISNGDCRNWALILIFPRESKAKWSTFFVSIMILCIQNCLRCCTLSNTPSPPASY